MRGGPEQAAVHVQETLVIMYMMTSLFPGGPVPSALCPFAPTGRRADRSTGGRFLPMPLASTFLSLPS
ncbi:hypothetical protein C1N80_04620 [Brachybacterium sp. SGAir0954]|nr:hypothetical protein C1N80_04620 [Brachybacterium sp. SGAir0954]